MSVDIDQADYTAIRKRAIAAETELAIFRKEAPFIADALELYAHALETGALDGAGHYQPEDIREAAAALPQED